MYVNIIGLLKNNKNDVAEFAESFLRELNAENMGIFCNVFSMIKDNKSLSDYIDENESYFKIYKNDAVELLDSLEQVLRNQFLFDDFVKAIETVRTAKTKEALEYALFQMAKWWRLADTKLIDSLTDEDWSEEKFNLLNGVQNG